MKRFLPVLPRREILLLAVAATGAAACLSTDPLELDAEDDTDASPDDSVDAESGDVSDASRDASSTRDASSDARLDGSTHLDASGTADAHDATTHDAMDATHDVTDAAHDATADVATCTPGHTRVGTVSNFPRGTWHLISSPHVIIGHDSGGLYAYSSVCTHAGCIVDAPNSSGIAYCPCHGSEFNGNGGVVRGPASTPLRHYRLTVCMGIVYVNTSITVSASTRTSPTG